MRFECSCTSSRIVRGARGARPCHTSSNQGAPNPLTPMSLLHIQAFYLGRCFLLQPTGDDKANQIAVAKRNQSAAQRDVRSLSASTTRS